MIMNRLMLLCVCLIAFAACNKKGSESETAWKIGDVTYSGLSTMRADNAVIVKSPESASFIYARFAETPSVNGNYTVVSGTPTSANEISFSVNRNGEDYISSGSGNPVVNVTVGANKKLNISITNVWMIHLPLKQDSLLLDAVIIEQ